MVYLYHPWDSTHTLFHGKCRLWRVNHSSASCDTCKLQSHLNSLAPPFVKNSTCRSPGVISARVARYPRRDQEAPVNEVPDDPTVFNSFLGSPISATVYKCFKSTKIGRWIFLHLIRSSKAPSSYTQEPHPAQSQKKRFTYISASSRLRS